MMATYLSPRGREPWQRVTWILARHPAVRLCPEEEEHQVEEAEAPFDSIVRVRYDSTERSTDAAKGRVHMHQRLLRLRDASSQWTPARLLSVALVCLAIASAAQHRLDQRRSMPLAASTYLVAALAFVLLVRNAVVEARTDAEDVTPGPRVSASTVAAGLVVALLGCLDFSGNRFRPPGLLLWIGGLLVIVLYLWLISSGEERSRQFKAWWRSPSLRIPWQWLLLAAIVLLGAWFRLRLLHEIPADLGPDLIYNYQDAWGILEGKLLVFFPESHGREGLFFYCIALCARLIGLSQYTLLLASALIGIVTIVAVYALGRQAFNGQIGLLAALLLAVNRWHIALSRAGYRVVTMPLFTALALYAFLRALRKRQPVNWAWAGIMLGLGAYTYKSWPFVGIALAAGLGLHASVYGWSRLRPLLPGLALMAALAVVVMAPMGLYALENPHSYLEREEIVRRLQRESPQPSPGLWVYYERNALSFNYVGDSTSRWNVPGARHMGFVSGMLMVLGLAYSLLRWRHGANAFVAAAWFVLILPGALGMLPNDLPNSLRLSGTIIPAVLLAALPLPLLGQRLQLAAAVPQRGTALPASGAPQTESPADARGRPALREWTMSLDVRSFSRHLRWSWRPARTDWTRLLLIAAALVLLVQEAREANRFYFRDFVATAPDYHNYSNSRAIAREVAHYGDLQSVYIKGWPFWFDAQAVRVTLGMKDREWNPFIEVLAADQWPLSSLQGPALFIVHGEDQAALGTLYEFFPRGLAVPRYYPDGNLSFYAFYGER